MPPVKPLIYAELLSNIRQISILAFLDTPSDSFTKAELSADGTLLTLHHAEQDIELKLPGQVASSSELRKFPTGSLEISWRLPLAGEFQRADIENAQTFETPWSAKDMISRDQCFECRRCSTTIVESDRIKEWRDLPSEGWAEMMDLWHCHKPDANEKSHENDNQSELASTKGYGANTRFTAQHGVGFVDHTTFLLAEEDCNLPREGNEIKRPIKCENDLCQETIGYSDPQNKGIRLYKWGLRMGTLEDSPSSTPLRADPALQFDIILSAQFLAIMNASCVSRLRLLPYPVAHDDVGANYKGASIWIFNPSIRFTTSYFYHTRKQFVSTSGRPGILAMKILWKGSPPVRESDDESEEVLELPGSLLWTFEKHLLKVSERHLPPSARKLQDWNVSLLERYEAKTTEA